jgi:putative colanic acid biosynthesis glycosyltransferase WcaI
MAGLGDILDELSTGSSPARPDTKANGRFSRGPEAPHAGTGMRPLRVQLWSYNYDPEPTGIGPVSRVLAEGLRDRGHQVEVVAAHPHYPEPQWGTRKRPYREHRNGIPVLRLPLWVGRATTAERYRQELTYMSSQFAALPLLGRPDVVVSASPSFPALLPAIVNARMRRTPWLLWLHDILPDGAAATGLVKPGLVMGMARRLERAAYREADRIVVLSSAFTANLLAKGVPKDKIELIYDPATRVPRRRAEPPQDGRPRLITMGNIGFSQGLAPLVEAFEGSDSVREHDARLVITGNGVAADDVREKISSDRVEMLGVVDDDRLESELGRATIGLVSQVHEGAEFNIPSKLMNFMAYGLPVLAVVNPRSEVARIVNKAQGGWVVDSSDPDAYPAKIAELAENPADVAAKSRAATWYAGRKFSQRGFAEHFEEALRQALDCARRRGYRTTASSLMVAGWVLPSLLGSAIPGI